MSKENRFFQTNPILFNLCEYIQKCKEISISDLMRSIINF